MIGKKDSIVISYEKLFNFITKILEKHHVPNDEAKIVAETLATANLRGIDSHGVARLPIYVKRLSAGSIRPTSKITIVKETPSIAVIDAHQSFGQIAGYKAMELAIKKAKSSGIGVVGVRNSEHFGAAAFFAMMALRSNMIGISITNTTPLMPPTGGVKHLLKSHLKTPSCGRG